MTQDGRKIREQILALLARKDYRPLDKSELAKALGRKSGVRMGLNQVLGELEHSGEIARIRKNRYVLPAEADLVAGKLSIHQAGYGFLVTDKPGEPDIFVAAENTGTAMHGDRVVVRIARDEPYARAKDRKGRREGRVIRILERAHDTIVGTLQHSGNFYYVVSDDPRLVHNVYVHVPPRAPVPKIPVVGDKVVVHLEAWESRHVNPEGDIVEVLGPASEPGVDMLSIIRKYHLPTEFPKDVLDEANEISETIDARKLEGREDLRKNSSLRSIRTMPAISTTPFTLRRPTMAGGCSACTLPMLPLTWSRAARSTAKRARAGTAFICPTAWCRCCRKV